MRKIIVGIAVGVFCLSAYPLKLGLEYKATDASIIGVNLGLADNIELKPQLGFSLGDSKAMDLLVQGNYYFPDISELSHYAGFGIGYSVWDDGGNSNIDNNDFYLEGHYGLRYAINEVVSLFGEIGLAILFDPFIMRTMRPGLGVTFFIPSFN